MVLVFLKFISQSYDMEWYPLNDQIAILILVEMDFENPLLAKKKNHKKPFIRHHYQEYTQWGSDLLYKHFLKLEKDNYIILLKINFNRF